MSRKWTEQQADAINARGGSLLISAAAGSGKTAVLVERVIRRITDKDNPVDADRLLIVTFTKMAAGEMRERIMKAVEQCIKANPSDRRLVRQQVLLKNAKICTIDSFCSQLVRENFQLLDIAPDFRTADESELAILKKKAVDETLERMYSQGSEDFISLAELLQQGNDDSYLEQVIQKIYESSRSFPFPDEWLEGLSKGYDSSVEVCSSSYGRLILSYVEQAVGYARGLFRYVLSQSAFDPSLEASFSGAVGTDTAVCDYVLTAIREGQWNRVRDALDGFKPARRKKLPDAYKEDTFALGLVAIRDEGVETLKQLNGVLCCSSEDYSDDAQFFSGPIKSLVGTVQLFSKIYAELKRSAKLADFSDIMHMAISLLVKGSGDGYEKTDLAKSISNSFDEILIDEYQDTNSAQVMLFSCIARDNLFRVGDVKQSIYSFRQAMPELFVGLKESLEKYDRQKQSFPSKIILGNNFRSRRQVTDIINFIFSQIMTAESGDIDYGEEEMLISSADYPEKQGCEAELHLLETGDGNMLQESSHEYQARYIARIIRDMVTQGYKVREGEGERAVRYSDFAVLFRALSSKGVVYANVLRQEGIPCSIEVSDAFLSSSEVSLVLNLLRIIDNPGQDIPLLGVMMSPVFGFSTDEVAKIKKPDKKAGMYSCVLQAQAAGDEHCDFFIEKLRLWRSMSICLTVGELINELYEQTALPHIFNAMDSSGTKKANLMLLAEYADAYEKTGSRGLSGFIRFIDRLKNQKQDLTGALGGNAQADAVRLMTIHKSKGLEFPVCILANCAGQFNRQDETPALVMNRRYGVGIIRKDFETMDRFDTVAHRAVRLAIHKDSISEELRVLYVALTRAKEKLIMIHGEKGIEKALMRYSADAAASSERINDFAVTGSKSYGQWLLTSLLRHPDAHQLRSMAGISEDVVLSCPVGLRVVVAEYTEAQDSLQQKKETQTQTDRDFYELVRQRSAFRYKYEELSGITMKRTASEVDRGFIDKEYFASSRPAFLCRGGLTPAQRGTATHKLMQFADYEAAGKSLDSEIIRLRDAGLLSDNEVAAIDREKIKIFLEGPLMKRILASEKIIKEKRFLIEVPVSQIYPHISEAVEQGVMIQGACDCAFVEDGELVVIDYKTDKVETEQELAEKYRSQLLLYKKALELCTGLRVKQTLLYSFCLSREIEVR